MMFLNIENISHVLISIIVKICV